MRVIGLMSGTSLDGIDAALVRFDGAPADLRWSLEAFLSVPYTPERRSLLHDAILSGSARTLCNLHALLGEWFAEVVHALLDEAAIAAEEIDVIGSHGQTIWHDPPAEGRRGATLQLGCPATLAERTGIPVISDFRARDMAAGGQGAPLVPFADRLLFALPDRARVLQNIGGIANLARVPPRGSDEPIVAFDTGPGNAPIDAAVEMASAGAFTYDVDGAWAARGRVDAALLAELLAHPFFAKAPPRSTGREAFGRPYVESLALRRAPADEAAWADLIATLTALTARTIADAFLRWGQPAGVAEVVLTGGGARNPVLVQMLRDALDPIAVRTGPEVGIDPDAKEAIAFAALAWAHLNGQAGNVPAATGAAGPRLLGSFTPGSNTGVHA